MGTTKKTSLHHFSCNPLFLSPFRFASQPLLDEDLNEKPPLLRGLVILSVEVPSGFEPL